eukprot:RCo012022
MGVSRRACLLGAMGACVMALCVALSWEQLFTSESEGTPPEIDYEERLRRIRQSFDTERKRLRELSLANQAALAERRARLELLQQWAARESEAGLPNPTTTSAPSSPAEPENPDPAGPPEPSQDRRAAAK